MLIYDRRTQWLHWATASAVAALWCLGQAIDLFPRGAPRIDARSVHVTLGALAILLVVYRLWWRALRGRRLRAALPGAAGQLARAGHAVLYGLLVAALALGIANVWVRGDALFNLASLPSFAPDDRPLHRLIGNLHAWATNALVVLAGGHALLALLHETVWRHPVLGRMWPIAPRERARRCRPGA